MAGLSNKQIARKLSISEYTVKNHMQRLFRKLDVSNRAQAVGRLQEQDEGYGQSHTYGRLHHA